jgi:hypothetical protein
LVVARVGVTLVTAAGVKVRHARIVKSKERRKIIFYLLRLLFTILRGRSNIGAMRVMLGVVAVALLLLESGGSAKPAYSAPTSILVAQSSASTSAPTARVDFDTQIKPMLQSKCMPCHFSGGQMYERLPFDKPATIRKLGTRLFTRIREEDKRRLIEDFLAQSP